MIFGPNMTYKLQVGKDLKMGFKYWKTRQIGFHLYRYLNFTLIWFVRIYDLVEITLHAFRNKIVFGDYCYCACLIKCICNCLYSCKNPQFYGKCTKPMTSNQSVGESPEMIQPLVLWKTLRNTLFLQSG